MTIFLDRAHFSTTGPTLGGVSATFPHGWKHPEPSDGNARIVSGSIGLTFLLAAGARESASLAQNRVPPSSARALSQHRAPAAPSARARAGAAAQLFHRAEPVAACAGLDQPFAGLTWRAEAGARPNSNLKMASSGCADNFWRLRRASCDAYGAHDFCAGGRAKKSASFVDKSAAGAPAHAAPATLGLGPL